MWCRENEFGTFKASAKRKFTNRNFSLYISAHAQGAFKRTPLALHLLLFLMLFSELSNDIGHFILRSNDIWIRVCVFLCDELINYLKFGSISILTHSPLSTDWMMWRLLGESCSAHIFRLFTCITSPTNIREFTTSARTAGFIANVTYCSSLNEHSYLLVLFSTLFFNDSNTCVCVFLFFLLSRTSKAKF